MNNIRLGIGDWGLGIGDWAQSPIPNPQSPIPNNSRYINLISKEVLVVRVVKSGLSSCEFLVDFHNMVQIFIIIVLKRGWKI
jgi:hypothetical protein